MLLKKHGTILVYFLYCARCGIEEVFFDGSRHMALLDSCKRD